jgi:hypothetical protein
MKRHNVGLNLLIDVPLYKRFGGAGRDSVGS